MGVSASEASAFVQRVMKWRQRHGVSQYNASWYVGVCPRTYNYWEQGIRLPSTRVYAAAVKRFDRLSKQFEERGGDPREDRARAASIRRVASGRKGMPVGRPGPAIGVNREDYTGAGKPKEPASA